MNILHISPYVPDVRASHAGGVCSGKQVETLKKNNNVYVITFVNDDYEMSLIKDHPDYKYVKTSKLYYIIKVLAHMGLPNMFALRKDRKFKRMICETIERKHIDVVHAEFTAMGQYIWLKKKYPNIRFHLAEHDVAIQSYERQVEEAKGLKKIYALVECHKVRKCENRYIKLADLVFTFNEKDGKLLREKYGANNVKVINPYYGLDFENHESNIKKEKSICFVGQMGRDENHVAAMRLIKIFKELQTKDWKLNIIGAHPQKELQQQESENIHITGFVDDINAEIEKNEIAVFPLTYGAGIKLKVLLAFGLGLPVVTSHVGAEGIDEEGNVILLAETDEEFKKQMKKLMEDDLYRSNKSKESIAFVKDRFSWSETEKIFDEVYR